MLTARIFKKCLSFVAWSCQNKREFGAWSLQKNEGICRRRQNLFKIQTFLSDVKKETMIFQMMGISIQDIGSEFILQNTVLIGITTNCGQTSLTVTRMCKIHVHRFRSHSFYIKFFFVLSNNIHNISDNCLHGKKNEKEFSSGNQDFYSFLKWNAENFWSKEKSNYWSIVCLNDFQEN